MIVDWLEAEEDDDRLDGEVVRGNDGRWDVGWRRMEDGNDDGWGEDGRANLEGNLLNEEALLIFGLIDLEVQVLEVSFD